MAATLTKIDPAKLIYNVVMFFYSLIVSLQGFSTICAVFDDPIGTF
jgi:hypothetical protein